jgi:hypothetical protein
MVVRRDVILLRYQAVTKMIWIMVNVSLTLEKVCVGEFNVEIK